jgi:LytS/YehU family sensor histidine kinase
MQRLYLDIEQVRFPGRLAVKVDVANGLEDAQVPSLILQPLVENVIKHGVARSSEQVVITICARKIGDRLQLTVEDDAQGAIEACPRDGVGLSNVRERLAAAFDGKASFLAGPRDGGGFRVELQIPLQFDA